MRTLRRILLSSPVALVLAFAWTVPGAAIAAEPSQAQAPAQQVIAGYLTQETEPRIPISFVDPVLTDEGVQGARLGIADNATTGRFTGQSFQLDEAAVPRDGDVAQAFRAMVARGVRLVLADLPADRLLAVADLAEARDTLIFNVRAKDDDLRNARCRPNVLHVIPSRAMLADALAQYLVRKRWTDWFLVIGRAPEDQAFAAAIKRAAKRFGARIVEEKPWTFDVGHNRTDSGPTTALQEIQVFTQVRDHDVLVVADESDAFGDYLGYHTARPRPIAGTQGLVPTAWSRVHEQWGATQLQNRFQGRTGRWMTERDYAAWVAVRSIGEAATRTRSADPATIATYLRGADFALGAFKGQALSYRDWDGQLRQPVLLADARMLVSVSPQEGFLHQFSELDTLGHDRPETGCRFQSARK